MNTIFRLFVIILLFNSCSPYQKYFDYRVSKNELNQPPFKTILLTGYGTSGTNLFLETLAKQLNQQLNKKQIQFVHVHLGNNAADAFKIFNQLVTENSYDAVLRFVQTDATNNPVMASSGNSSINTGSMGNMNIKTASRTIRFHQKYSIQCFAGGNLTSSLLNANLDLNINFLDPVDYSNLTKDIIKSLSL